MIGEIAGDRKFASVQGGVAEAVDAVFSDDFQRDEIASGTANDNFGVNNFHGVLGKTF